MKITVENKQYKNDIQLHKNRWIFFKLSELVDGFILRCVPFIWSY